MLRILLANFHATIFLVENVPETKYLSKHYSKNINISASVTKSFNQDKENVLLIFKVEKINIACHPINYSCSHFLIKPARMSAIHISSFQSIDLKGKILP